MIDRSKMTSEEFQEFLRQIKKVFSKMGYRMADVKYMPREFGKIVGKAPSDLFFFKRSISDFFKSLDGCVPMDHDFLRLAKVLIGDERYPCNRKERRAAMAKLRSSPWEPAASSTPADSVARRVTK